MSTRMRTWLVVLSAVLLGGADWPQFRGPGGSGAAGDASGPLGFDPQQHTAWQVELPGRGPSSPIVVGGRVFVTASTGVRQDRLHVLCFDAGSGRRLWERQFWATGRTATHATTCCAAPTPASDGQHVYAFYSSNDLVCLDLDGRLRWYRGLVLDYPKTGNDVGMASSPVVADGVVVVQAESQSEAFAAGIDAATGETRWRVDRTRKASWCSPIAVTGAGSAQTAIVLQSTDCLTGHDPQSGRQLWRFDADCAGISSPATQGEWLLVPMKGLSLFRIADPARTPELVWEVNRLRPGSSSPVLYQGRVYAVSGAIVKCADLAHGELLWQLRLRGNHWSSPVAAAGRLYCFDDQGGVCVVQLGEREGKIVGEARFSEKFQASPAVAGNALYVRTDRHLWKLVAPGG